jgi:hypothetical protein
MVCLPHIRNFKHSEFRWLWENRSNVLRNDLPVVRFGKLSRLRGIGQLLNDRSVRVLVGQVLNKRIASRAAT